MWCIFKFLLFVIIAATAGTFFYKKRHAAFLKKKMTEFWPGKTVLITGARTGFGKACALLCARHGCNLMITSRNADGLGQTVAEIQAAFPAGSNCRVETCSLDICNHEDHKTVVRRVSEAFGKLDVLILSGADVVNEICMKYEGPEERMRRFRQCCEPNLFGNLEMITTCLPLLHRSHGTICFISSVSGKLASPCGEIFTATKHAMHGYLDCIRDSYASGIHICFPCVRWTQTESISQVMGADVYKVSTPVSENAQKILEAVAAQMYERQFGWDVYISLIIRLWVPHFVQKWIYKDSPKIILDACAEIREKVLTE